MTMFILLTIIFYILTIFCTALTIVLISDKNCFAILTGILSVALFILTEWTSDMIGPNTHTIKKVQTVQIDTVITTCKGVSDTTYVINYTK